MGVALCPRVQAGELGRSVSKKLRADAILNSLCLHITRHVSSYYFFVYDSSRSKPEQQEAPDVSSG